MIKDLPRISFLSEGSEFLVFRVSGSDTVVKIPKGVTRVRLESISLRNLLHRLLPPTHCLGKFVNPVFPAVMMDLSQEPLALERLYLARMAKDILRLIVLFLGVTEPISHAQARDRIRSTFQSYSVAIEKIPTIVLNARIKYGFQCTLRVCGIHMRVRLRIAVLQDCCDCRIHWDGENSLALIDKFFALHENLWKKGMFLKSLYEFQNYAQAKDSIVILDAGRIISDLEEAKRFLQSIDKAACHASRLVLLPEKVRKCFVARDSEIFTSRTLERIWNSEP